MVSVVSSLRDCGGSQGTCDDEAKIIYAWARNAPPTKLPRGNLSCQIGSLALLWIALYYIGLSVVIANSHWRAITITSSLSLGHFIKYPSNSCLISLLRCWLQSWRRFQNHLLCAANSLWGRRSFPGYVCMYACMQKAGCKKIKSRNNV